MSMDIDLPDLSIRLARTAEAGRLTRIAHAAKAWWGYSPQDIERWRAELTFTPELISRWPTWVACVAGEVVGTAQLRTEPRFELEACWVHPSAVGKGVGRQLVDRVMQATRLRGGGLLWIDADPNAEGFYLRLGAVRVGVTPAPVTADPGRVRPLLQRVIGSGGAGGINPPTA